MNVEKKWSLAIGTVLVAAALLTGSAFASASDAVTTEVQEVQQILSEQDDDVTADEECEEEGKGGQHGFHEKKSRAEEPDTEPEQQEEPAPSNVGGK